jgi:hypothetical protein
LTDVNSSDRQAALENMFRSVGQVMHLLQDTTSPQHVRNEQHLAGSEIEEWGERDLGQLNCGDGSMLDWRAAGFSKLEDFWNRHLYNGDAAALGADKNENPNGGPHTLGLAEWCNGNFPGERHQYAAYYPQGDIRHYPYPSLSGTDYGQLVANPLLGIDYFVYGKAIYLAKTGNGIPITHHSRLTYFGIKHLNKPGPRSTTVDDENVLEEYHNKLIPRAVKYSAGLLDYYFRGQLKVGVSPNISGGNGTLKLTIKNVSKQPFSGGTFHLYYDIADGTRTELTSSGNNGDPGFWTGWGSGSTLASNENTTAKFTPPSGTVKQYILVYQGTIGAASGPQSDPIDYNIAIAAKTFTPSGYSFWWWNMDDLFPTNEPIPGWFCSDSLEGVPLCCWVDYQPGTIMNVPGKIGSAVQFSVNTDSTGWGGENFGVGVSVADTGMNGATWCGWWKHSDYLQFDNISLHFWFGSSERCANIWFLNTPDTELAMSSGMAPDNQTTVTIPSNSGWHFFLLDFEPNPNESGIGTWRLQFDNTGEVYSVVGSAPVNVFDIGFEGFLQGDDQGSITTTFDELSMFPMQLTPAQKDFLYNSGAGRTWPFTLP